LLGPLPCECPDVSAKLPKGDFLLRASY
jgi:hypothetical protein